MKKYIIYILFFSFGGFLLASCDDYLDIQPKDRVIPENLEEYRALMTSGYAAFPHTKAKAALRTDLLSIDPSDFSASKYRDIFLWKDNEYVEETSEFGYDLLYRAIFYCNEVILSGGKDVEDSEEKNQLIGEAHALRAYAYFELINLFVKPFEAKSAGSTLAVPLVLKIDVEETPKRASLAKIYEQIFEDISKADALLNVSIQPAEVKYRFSKLSLEALKARVFLYKKEYAKALSAVNKVLAVNANLLDLNTAKDILPSQISSPENIQALDYAIDKNVNSMAYVSSELLELYNRENDLRFSLYYAESGDKYKVVKGNKEEHKCTFRVGELLLVKAECLYKEKKEKEAKQVLITLAEKRYNSEGFTAYKEKLESLSGNAFFEELQKERLRETAFEGYRWFDLRRNNQKAITHKFAGITEILKANDIRYTIAFPKSAKKENPNLVND